MKILFLAVTLVAAANLHLGQATCDGQCKWSYCADLDSSTTNPSYCTTCDSCDDNYMCAPIGSHVGSGFGAYCDKSPLSPDVDTGKAVALLSWAPMVPLSCVISVVLIIVAALPACCNVCLANAKCIGWITGVLGCAAALLFVIYSVIITAGGKYDGFGAFVAIPLLFTVGCGFLPFILGGIAAIIGCIACCKKPADVDGLYDAPPTVVVAQDDLHVTFQAGPLGIGLSCVQGGSSWGPGLHNLINEVVPGGQGEAGGVRLKQRVVAVNYVNVENLDFAAMMTQIESSPRPMTISFRTFSKTLPPVSTNVSTATTTPIRRVTGTVGKDGYKHAHFCNGAFGGCCNPSGQYNHLAWCDGDCGASCNNLRASYSGNTVINPVKQLEMTTTRTDTNDTVVASASAVAVIFADDETSDADPPTYDPACEGELMTTQVGNRNSLASG